MADGSGVLVHEPNLLIQSETYTAAVPKTDPETKKGIFGPVLFLSTVTGMSALLGFGYTLSLAKKQDPKGFNDGIVRANGLTETGTSLAFKALRRATVIAVTGFGILCYGFWKFTGATNAEEFRLIVGSWLPRIPRNKPPRSRTEFENLTDFLKYVSEDWAKEEAEGKWSDNKQE